MRFKDWLQLDEARFKGFKRLFQQEHPNMPKYVQNDLYNNRIGYTMKKLVQGNHGMGPDFDSPTVGMSGNNQGFTRTSDSDVPSDAASKIFQAHALDGYQWEEQILKVDPSDFDTFTTRILIERNFGYKEHPRIRDDSERTEKQRNIISKMLGDHEPVIVVRSPDESNRYRLLEGWHRSMAVFLQGAPEGQHNALQNLDTDPTTYINFTEWRKMPLKAFVGNLPEEVRARKSA